MMLDHSSCHVCTVRLPVHSNTHIDLMQLPTEVGDFWTGGEFQTQLQLLLPSSGFANNSTTLESLKVGVCICTYHQSRELKEQREGCP